PFSCPASVAQSFRAAHSGSGSPSGLPPFRWQSEGVRDTNVSRTAILAIATRGGYDRDDADGRQTHDEPQAGCHTRFSAAVVGNRELPPERFEADGGLARHYRPAAARAVDRRAVPRRLADRGRPPAAPASEHDHRRAAAAGRQTSAVERPPRDRPAACAPARQAGGG